MPDLSNALVIPMGAEDGATVPAAVPDRTAVLSPSPDAERHGKGEPANEQTTRAAEPATSTETPAKLFAGKYKTVEELERGYLEAQKTRSSAPKVDAEAAKTAANIEGEFSEETLNRYAKEIAEHGKLTDESRHGIKSRGFNDAAIDGYIKIFKLASVAGKTIAKGELGESYDHATKWLGSQPKAVQESVNRLLLSTEPDEVAAGAQMLNTLYSSQNHGEPRTIQGSRRAAQQGPEPFKSKAESLKAQSDPLYWDHESSEGKAYRAEWETRERLRLDAERRGS